MFGPPCSTLAMRPIMKSASAFPVTWPSTIQLPPVREDEVKLPCQY
jgi:hypothetical protein